MDAEDRIDPLQGALFDHAHTARLALVVRSLFAGLKEQAHGAGQAALVGDLLEQRGCAHQHRGVCIVAARVHKAGPRAVKVAAVLLLDRQGVHVGAQPYKRPMAAADMADHAGFGDLRLRLDAEVQHLLVDIAGCAVFFEGQLRILVNRPPPRADAVLEQPAHVRTVLRLLRACLLASVLSWSGRRWRLLRPIILQRAADGGRASVRTAGFRAGFLVKRGRTPGRRAAEDRRPKDRCSTPEIFALFVQCTKISLTCFCVLEVTGGKPLSAPDSEIGCQEKQLYCRDFIHQ